MAGFFERATEGLFFQPDRRPYWDHSHFGVKGEYVKIAGENHYELAGLWMPAFFASDATDTTPKGNVLFAHACIHNMQFHLPQVIWLVAAGFNVFTYDPRGCGRSPGSITLASIVEDLESAFGYLKNEKGIDPSEIIVFGQHAGAYAALLLAQTTPSIAGVILESVWATQSGYLLNRYGPGIGHLLKAFCPMRPDPIDALTQLKIPLALAVASLDRSIPESEQAHVMKACPKQREIWLEKGARHLDIFTRPSEARQRFLAFTQKVLQKDH